MSNIKLDLSEFRRFNVARSEAPFINGDHGQGGFNHAIDAWTPLEWAGALAGEVGEFANLLKKLRRGENIGKLDLADEACDVLCYLDLACASVDISLAQATVRKWDYVSMLRNYPILLTSRSHR